MDNMIGQMTAINQIVLPSAPGESLDGCNWFAVHTRARHERVVATQLREKGVTTFYPTVKETHHWSDRKKVVELPLFGCYVFVKIPPTPEKRLEVLRVNSVLSFVGVRGQGLPIPDDQILSVQTVLQEKLNFSAYPFLKIGQRVRIRSGALTGMEGILVSRNGDRTLVISVEAIQRSLAVRVEGYDVEPV
jgi:transcription antitermination factor NusG